MQVLKLIGLSSIVYPQANGTFRHLPYVDIVLLCGGGEWSEAHKAIIRDLQ